MRFKRFLAVVKKNFFFNQMWDVELFTQRKLNLLPFQLEENVKLKYILKIGGGLDIPL